MKKILARLTHVDSDDNIINPQSHNALFGRRFDIGNFSLTVEDVVAEGGFGVVFRVVSQHGHTYALKRTCVNNEHDLAVCKREITIVSSVTHKNIIRYVDSKILCTRPGIYEVLLLTVYYRGSLKHLIDNRKQRHLFFSEPEILRIFCDICEAICRLHHCKTPIIHRDLKIENILIDDLNNFVLCDFGSATSRVLHPGVHGYTRCQEEIAKYTTLAYRAPEIINLHDTVPLGPQIDIWALGCLLYCLCFFKLPFGESALAIQSGNFCIPDKSSYSENMHKLIGYILCLDAFKRPDIFQVCALAFSLDGRTNPAQNLNNLQIPSWKDLSLPPRESHAKISHSSTATCMSSVVNSSKVTTDPKMNSSRKIPITNTSVAPRERPRAGGQHVLTKVGTPITNITTNARQSSFTSSNKHDALHSEASANPFCPSDSFSVEPHIHEVVKQPIEMCNWKVSFGGADFPQSSGIHVSTDWPNAEETTGKEVNVRMRSANAQHSPNGTVNEIPSPRSSLEGSNNAKSAAPELKLCHRRYVSDTQAIKFLDPQLHVSAQWSASADWSNDLFVTDQLNAGFNTNGFTKPYWKPKPSTMHKYNSLRCESAILQKTTNNASLFEIHASFSKVYTNQTSVDKSNEENDPDDVLFGAAFDAIREQH